MHQINNILREFKTKSAGLKTLCACFRSGGGDSEGVKRVHLTLLLQALCTLPPQQLPHSEEAQPGNSQSRQTMTSDRFKTESVLLST